MNQETNRKHRGWRVPSSTELALDLRTWIAAMFATFGTMLAVYGAFFATPEDLAKGAGINLNLWTGVGLLVVALLSPSGCSRNRVLWTNRGVRRTLREPAE